MSDVDEVVYGGTAPNFPALPSPRLTSAGCSCYESFLASNGTYVPKNCALHAPHEFDEYRPTIGEIIKGVRAENVRDVDDLVPVGIEPVTMPCELAKEMVQQFTMLLERKDIDCISTDDLAEIFVRRATLHSGMKNHDKALNDCLQAISLRNDYTPAMFRGGHAAFKTGNYAQAMDLFQRGLKLSPQNSALQKGFRCAVMKGLETLKRFKNVDWSNVDLESLTQAMIAEKNDEFQSSDPQKLLYSTPSSVSQVPPSGKQEEEY